jgi:hypothetical protein
LYADEGMGILSSSEAARQNPQISQSAKSLNL